MNLKSIRNNLMQYGIYNSDEPILGRQTVIGYEKKFRWLWFATQLNTFIVASDFGKEPITVDLINKHLTESFEYSKRNYKGWPRGLQSGVWVISILMSSELTQEARDFCVKMKAGKKWAGFAIPIVVDSVKNQTHLFEKDPIWGKIYYPHFRRLIEMATK